jgi:hypothetical protein
MPGAMPEPARPAAKAPAVTCNAGNEEKARTAVKALAALSGAKFPEAAAKVTGDTNRLPASCGVPAGRWSHWPAAKPVGSAFATARLRATVTKGAGPKAAGLARAFQLLRATGRRWRVVHAPHLVALVRAGAGFADGKLVERAEDQAPCENNPSPAATSDEPTAAA